MYLGYDNKWLKLGDFFLFDGTDGQSYRNKYNISGDASISFQNNKIHLQSNQGTYINGTRQGSATTKNAIDLSKFNTLFIELAYNQYSSASTRYGMFELINTEGSTILSRQYTNYTSRNIVEVDVSQINVECNIKFTIYNNYTGENTSNYNVFEIFNAYLR